MTSLREDPNEARRVLTEKRAEILRLLEGGDDAAATIEVDQQQSGEVSSVDVLQQQALVQDVERRRRQELARIDAALERLEAGEYGWCMACGEPIPDARLAFDPAVALCVACAERG